VYLYIQYVNYNIVHFLKKKISKENFLQVNELLLCIIAYIIIIGTITPIIFSKWFYKEIFLGPTFFNKIIGPIIIPFLIFITIGPFLMWGSDSFKRINVIFNYSYGYIIYIAIYIIYYIDNSSLLNNIIIFLTSWALINIIYLLYYIKIHLLSMYAAHIGIITLIFSICFNNNYQFSIIEIINPGNQINFNNWILSFRNIFYSKTLNYDSIDANIYIENKYTTPITIINPEIRSYELNSTLNYKPAINNNILSDIYITLGDGGIYEGWYIKIIYNPMMSILWVSMVLIIIGGLISIVYIKKKIYISLYWLG